MRLGVAALLLAVGCRPPLVAPPEPARGTSASVEARPAEPEPATPEPEPVARPVFIDDGWVLDADDPAAPLLRLDVVRPERLADDAPLRALLGQVGSILYCYQAELSTDPELRATLRVHRHGPDERERDPTIEAVAEHPTSLVECVTPHLRPVLAAVIDDPDGRYEIDLYPHRDRAPHLRLPDPDEPVMERAGGSCWTLRTFPCAPHKHCMAPQWERTRCRHPADRPQVAVRWAFGAATDDGWPREGVELVALDDTVLWRARLPEADAKRLGPLAEDEARRHLEDFRDHDLPGALWQSLEPDRVLVADRAGVREYERRTGALRFRFAAPDHLRPPALIFDDGSFTAVRRARRCAGEAHDSAFATRCGDDLLYFDGFTLAVIGMLGPLVLDGQTNVQARGSRRGGTSVNPRATLRAGGYSVQVEGVLHHE